MALNRFASLCFLMLVSLQSWIAQATSVELVPGINQYRVAADAFYLEDPEGKLAIGDVINSDRQLDWKPSPSDIPHFAFSQSVYWLKMDVKSTFAFSKEWWLELAFPLHDYVEYFVTDGEAVIQHVKTGDRLPVSSRPYNYRNFLFNLEVPAQESRQIYMRFEAYDGLHEPIPLILWDKETFGFENGLRNLGLGVYFGILFVIAFYNLFIYISVKDKAYLYYVLYIACFNTWLFGYYGFAFQYLWPDSPDWSNRSIILFTGAWSIFVVQFTREFLHTATNAPWFEPIVKTMIVLLLLAVLAGIIGNYSLGIFLVVAVGVPGCIVAIIAGFVIWRKGYRPAAYFLLAWSALFIALACFCLKIAAVIPSSWVVERSIQIGSAVEVVLLSLGLADRINILKKEKIQAQKEALESYESSLKLKNDFIMAITHELRTPMNAIMGGVQVADDKLNKDLDIESPMGMIQSGATDMMNIVSDILIHTEIQSGKLKINSVPVDLKAMCKQLESIERPLCELKNVNLVVDIHHDVPESIEIDKDKLTLILTKLLGNARKFTESGKVTLSVNCDYQNQQLIMVVADTGPGIAEEDQEKIFNPFVQKEGGFARRHSGVGIGLSICERLADALGGRLTLESKLGEGSEFVLSLPLKISKKEKQEEAVQAGDSSLPILVVEDNLVNQKVIVKMLEKLGYRSLVANHGVEALSVLDANDVSLVLMDLQMPTMDGFTCSENIRKRGDNKASLPIIAVSANLMDADKQHCKESGIYDYIEKPVKLDLLDKHLKVFLSGKQTEQSL